MPPAQPVKGPVLGVSIRPLAANRAQAACQQFNEKSTRAAHFRSGTASAAEPLEA